MMEIRPVLPVDAESLSQVALAAKRHWGYPERWIQIWTPLLTLSPEYFQTNESWAAVQEERPIAFYTLLEADGSASIENLWVLPDFMRMGVGKRLFLHAVDLARERGHSTLRLEADPNALGFYERMGMREVADRHTEVDGQPRTLPIMEMAL